MEILGLFKSHYSIGKSILTLEDSFQKNGAPNENSVFHILKENNLTDLCLVDDGITGLLEASTNAQKNNINLYFGLRLWVTSNSEEKTEESLKKRAKYIIFIKNQNGYKRLIKIWSHASTSGFYFSPTISFNVLRTCWDDNDLKLVIPYFDSFLHLNSLEGYYHIPDFELIKNSTLFLEENELPWDFFMKKKIEQYGKENSLPVQRAQSIYYRYKDDFVAYLAFRCLHKRTQLERPELTHMSSDTFNFERWMEIK